MNLIPNEFNEFGPATYIQQPSCLHEANKSKFL